ncbi:FG-GAP repeat domain-containing protein [Neoroseomonas oryzicola]|uniref:DUF4114 domain-containing protein n=1 Tax=Neoroseomonas oryzicola TaxID=535904 RepID=A0A9X9WCJ7_9PROT|nr:VCBS repeat-containing protein [Neoroseomonas oryzicola]MBR0658057.1 DUF4114 domain-containing protein [Neoroseomonas oryzicola]NKE15414.1 DUF4114 domain-containing protein [Neoroseomonas oryzicola]
MPVGLDSLPDDVVIGAQSSSSTTFSYSLFQSLKESNEIYSVTGGLYREGPYSDLVFAQADGLHWRAYDPSTNEFDGSVVFGGAGDTDYVHSVDLNNDGFLDLVGTNRDSPTSGDPNSVRVYNYVAEPNAAPGAAPFTVGSYNTIPIGAMIMLSSNDIVQVHDSAFADFNGDGKMDIIVAGVNEYDVSGTSGGNDTDVYGCYAIGLGNGDGTFAFQGFQYTSTEAGGQNGTAGLQSGILARVTAGDFDGDGLVDVAFAYHPDNGLPFSTPYPTAFIVWGDAGSSSSTPVLNVASSNTYTNSWDNPQDVLAVRPSASAPADQLVIAFNSSLHIASFNADRTLNQDTYINGIPRGDLGTALDYDLDGSPDIMVVDGNSSAIFFGFDWTATGSSFSYGAGNLTMGVDIDGGAGLDFNGDGKPDFYGPYKDYLYVYENTTATTSNAGQVRLTEGISVAGGAINGVGAGFMTGSGDATYTVTVIGGRSAYDNALGWFEMRADGTFGAARFIDLDAAAGGVNLGTPAEGSRIGLFLVANGVDLNGDLDGAFRFVDRLTGGDARIGSADPLLVRDMPGGGAILGDIFHSLDVDPLDVFNPLNTGGRVQMLSRLDADGSLVIGIEDLRLANGDADFNDLVLRVAVTEPLFGT